MLIAGLGAVCIPLSMSQIYSVARNAGFPPDVAVTMTAVAMRESGGCPTAHNPGMPIGAEDSYGLWQINILGNPGLLRDMGITPTQLYDPQINAAAAYRLWGGNSQNLNTAWYLDRPGYREGYQQYLPAAQLAAASVEGDSRQVASLDSTGPASDPTAVVLAGLGDMPTSSLFLGGALLLAAIVLLTQPSS